MAQLTPAALSTQPVVHSRKLIACAHRHLDAPRLYSYSTSLHSVAIQCALGARPPRLERCRLRSFTLSRLQWEPPRASDIASRWAARWRNAQLQVLLPHHGDDHHRNSSAPARRAIHAIAAACAVAVENGIELEATTVSSPTTKRRITDWAAEEPRLRPTKPSA